MDLIHIPPRICFSASIRFTVFFACCCCAIPLYAQTRVSSDSLLTPVVRSKGDSTSGTRRIPFRTADTTAGDTLKSTYRPTKSPGLAMLLSAIVPGAGQLYNQSYWKVPVVLGFGVYFVSEWLSNNRRYLDFRDRYSASLQTTPNNSLKTSRDFYRDQRDAFAWYYLIMYVINIADAYVDASLYDFNVGDDLSLRFMPGEPVAGRQGPGLRITIGF